MTTALRPRYAPGLHWWVRRNPTYLLSAACIALGCRMLLVSPEKSPAGDAALILLTLAALQLYEWAVTACLLALHRGRRAPEDEPSLLLVAVLFWTGPLVATMEMSAQRADLGIILAVGACAVALAELHVVRRMMGWRFSIWGRLLAGGCVVLVTVAQPLLKIPEGQHGTNELLLYATWWCVAVLALLALPAIRWHARRDVPGRDAALEGALMLAAVAAAVAHLAAMNHAFVGHTRLFYASPLLLALAIALIEWGACRRPQPNWAAAFGPWLPAVAAWFACDRFHADVPIDLLPLPLHDPLLTTLTLAAVVYVCGFVRLRWYALLHAGVLAAAGAAYRAWPLIRPDHVAEVAEVGGASGISQGQWAVAGYALAIYLAIFAWRQRSRWLGGLALAAQQAGLTCLLWERGALAEMVILFAAAWSLLAIAHVVCRRPPIALRAIPLVILLVAGFVFERNPELWMPIRLHAAVAVILLFAIGHWQRWTGYRAAACTFAVASQVPWVAEWTLDAPHGKAVMTVATGFFLLAVGATISWHKRELIASVAPEPAIDASVETTETE